MVAGDEEGKAHAARAVQSEAGNVKRREEGTEQSDNRFEAQSVRRRLSKAIGSHAHWRL